LKNELEHFEKIVEAQAKAISDDSERNEFYEYQSNEYWKLNESFVRILRNSFLITIFSFMENRIDAICDKLQKKHRMQISWRDLRGDILDRGALYIENFVGHSPNEISVWSNIRNYQKIRNSIVHNDGQIQEEAVIDYASKRELIHPVDR
jgi:hypothetical protein